MIIHRERQRPETWAAYLAKRRLTWLRPLYAMDWSLAWLAHALGRWVLLDVLEYLGSFSILIAVIFYFAGSGDRLKQKHYQAWQVINTAQGKGGSGGRVEALEELNADHVPLVGVDLSDAFLYAVNLNHALLSRSSFRSADLRSSSFQAADLTYATFNSANLRGADLGGANLKFAQLENADLVGADLSAADLEGASLNSADLRQADLRAVKWSSIQSVRLTNLYGTRNAPAGFTEWARHQGAVFTPEPEAGSSVEQTPLQ